MDMIEKALADIKDQLGRNLDLENETYILQTDSAYLQVSMIEDEETGENKINIDVTGGQVTYLETDNDHFSEIFGGNEWWITQWL